MVYPNRSCITECCKSYPFSLFPTKFCVCWWRAEHVNKRAFTALQEYCGFKQYVVCPRMQEINMQQEVDEAIKAIDNKLSSRSNQLMPDACCEKDKQKIKSCMLNTTSSEQCCPTFRAMIGVNCNCYNYAQDLDNQLLIVIESLCDVPNPCNKKAQVM
nr:PREDICTED: uncharacterized protein LOC107761735 [Nicotiana tabacum]